MAKTNSKKITIEEALVPVEEQPYQIPENWCWTRLSIVASIYNGDRGKNYPSKKDYVIEGIPFINAGTICENEVNLELANYITEEKFNALSAGKIKKNDILYCLRGSIGKCAIITEEYKGAISSSLCIMRSENKSIEVKYLLYLLNSDVILKQQNEVDNGSAQPNLSAANVAKYQVPLPPLAEQKRIVEQIENLFTKLDEVKEKTQEALGSVNGRKTAILLNALDGKYTDTWRKENNIDISSWEKKTIDDISDVKGGKRVPKGMSLVSENTGHPYIKAGNLKKGTVIDDGIQFVPNDVLDYIKNYTVKAGDVYITNVGACIGDCGVIPEKYDGANLTENAVKMTNLKDCESKFLAYYLASNHVQQIIKGLIASATLGKLSIANIKSIEIRMPSLPEQIEIVNTIDALWKREELVQKSVETVLEKIELLKKSILAKAFRGELGTNNPEEESAIELLKGVLEA